MNEQKIDCDIILDLLPLSFDHMVNKETESIIQEHLATCENCRQAYAEMGQSLAIFSDSNMRKKRKHRFKRKSLAKMIILGYIFVMLLIITLCIIDIALFF